MNPKLKQVADAIKAKQQEIDTILDQYGEGELSSDAIKSLTTLEADLGTLEAEFKTIQENEGAAKGIRERHSARKQAFRQAIMDAPFAGDASIGDAYRMSGGRKSLGQLYIESDAFKNWLQQVAPNGSLPSQGRIPTSPVLTLEGSYKSLAAGMAVKALVTGASDTSAGAFVRPDYYGDVSLPFRELTIRDVVTNLTTSSDAVDYARITGWTNNAAPTAEAVSVSTGLKPESGFAAEKVTANVKTIAHWIPASRRAVADAQQVRSYIDAFLEAGLDEELEDQIIQGDGNGENFLGLENQSGFVEQAFDTDIKTSIRKGRTKAKVIARAKPNVCLINPYDWEAVDLDQDNEARYYYGGPAAMGSPRIWNLPVIESEAVTQGTAWVMDGREILLWDREQTQIRVSDQHDDYFTKNLIAILAEMRAAMGIRRPGAIVKVALAA